MGSGITTPTEAYVTLDEVRRQKLPHRTYDADSNPTASAAEKTIKNVAASINAALKSLGYTPPLTGSDDILILGEINALGAASRIEEATLATVGGGDSETAATFKTSYNEEMAKLRSGEYQFTDAGGNTIAKPDGNDDLDSSGDRTDPIFIMENPKDSTSF